MDETFIWENVGRQWSWFPDNEPSAAIAAKASKGDRWTVINAGGADGWVPRVLFLRMAESSGDYHGTITGPAFERWFTDWLLRVLQKPSLIIMDNASFHRKRDHTISAMGVDALRTRLTRYRVAVKPGALRADLVALVKQHCDIRPRVEHIAHRAGHRVLWLPPYHPDLNPIERMWAVAKNSARANWRLARANHDAFLSRLDEAFSKCTPDVWRGAVDKSWKAAKSYVNFEQVMRDAGAADALPEPAYSDDEDDSDEKKLEIAAAAGAAMGSEAKGSPVAAAAGPARAASLPQPVTATPSRRSARKRVPSQKTLENADEGDIAPAKRARKPAASSRSR